MSRILLYILLAFLYVLSSYATPGNKKNHALVIIDMQPEFVTRGGNHKKKANVKKVDSVLATQVKMIEQAKKSGIPIVFLEYENYGDTNKALKKAVGDYKDANYFLKNTDGMFSEHNKYLEQLQSYLEEKDVGTLVITGANGGACVHQSIKGALDNKYSVVAFSKGIADFNYKDFIYPYDDLYSFKPNCKDCSFREFDKLPEYTLEIASGNIMSRKPNDNNRSRGSFKDDIPHLQDTDRHARPTSPVRIQ